MSTQRVRHEATLEKGTPGVLDAVISPLPCLDVRTSRNRHCPLDSHTVPAMDDLLICFIPAARSPVRVIRSWGGPSIVSDICADRLFVQLSGVATRWSWDGRFEALNLVIPNHAVLAFAEQFALRLDPERLGRAVLQDPMILAATERLWALGQEGGQRLLAEHLVAAVLHALAQERPQGTWHAGGKGGLAPWQVRRVLDHLRANLASEMSLAELAALVSLSPHHFCRAFRASTGLPPHRTHTRMRVERAQELLIGTALGIAEVGMAVGYGDPGQFGRIFRKETGLSPSRFRRETRR